VHGGQHGHRKPPEDRGGAGRTPQAVNTARADAGLRAGDRTGLGDCQSKGWTRSQRGTGSPCETLPSCQSGLPEPKPSSHTGGRDNGSTKPSSPAPCIRELRAHAAAGYRYRNIQYTRHSTADYHLEALSLTKLNKMQKDMAKAISTYEDRQKAEARPKVEAVAREMGYSLAELVGTDS